MTNRTKKHLFRYLKEKTRRQQRVIKTTLGDLIAAVTDEVIPFIGDPSSQSMVVARVLNNLLTYRQLSLRKQSRH